MCQRGDLVHQQFLQAALSKVCFLFTFANPATAIAVRRSPDLGKSFDEFDIIAPDGIGMVAAVRLIHGQSAERISFDNTSIAPEIFALAAEHHLKVALVGGREGVAVCAAERLRNRYVGLDIVGTFSGYGDVALTLRSVMELKPTIVIVGMGTGHQERFLLRLKASGWIGVGFTCGGFLDQLVAKGHRYYPIWIDALHLRWAYRLAKEPQRLWRRYIIDYPLFCACLARDVTMSKFNSA
jgi:N-acetylglucosaminyldiphosphoundecaprenol N-acetyl-beta-D-mannosaminyltransferase